MSKEFEHIVKGKFDKFEAQVSPDLFAKIVAQRKKRWTAIFWSRRLWWSAAAVLFIALGALLFHRYYCGDPANENLAQHQTNNTELNKDIEQNDNLPVSDPEELNVTENDPYSESGESVQVPHSDHNIATDRIIPDEPISIQEESVEETLDPLFVTYNSHIDYRKILIMDEGKIADLIVPHNLQIPEKIDIPEHTGPGQPDSTPKSGESNLTVGPLPKSPWSVGIYAGPGITQRFITSGETELITARNNTERPLPSLRIGADITYKLSDKWSLNTGLRFDQRNQKFDFAYTSTSFDTSINTYQITVINPPPIGTVLITKHDTSISSHTNTANYSSINRFKMLTVPLEIERLFPIGDNFSLLAKAGIAVSIYSVQTGMQLETGTSVRDISTLPYRRSGVLKSTLALGAAYRLNEHVSFLFYPHINYSLSPTYTKMYGMQERTLGMYSHFGIRVDL